MAKDTGLREEKCLGELPEQFTHTDYNGSGQKIYEEPPAGGRRPLTTDNRQQTAEY